VGLLPDVPAPVRIRLDEYHLERIGEVAAIGEQPLRIAFGRTGLTLHRHSLGIDPRPVLPPEVKAEFRAAQVLGTDTNDRTELRQLLRNLTQQIGTRLRHRGLAAQQLRLMVRHSDDTVIERKVSIAGCTLDAELWRAASAALDKALTRRVAVRSVALIATELHAHNVQLELWGEPVTAPERLQQAIDRVRQCSRT